MYQQITLIGNLGGEPTMRYTPTGAPVASFSLAVNKSWIGEDGQRHEKTTWFKVTAWRKLAETVTEYLKSGNRVLVVGEVEKASAYTDREGNLRATIEVTAQTVRFMTPKSENGGSTGGDHGAPAPEIADEEIPF